MLRKTLTPTARTQVHPFAQSTNLGILGARYKTPGSPRYSKALLSLIKCCLEVEVEDRVSSAELCDLVMTAMKGESVSTSKKKKKKKEDTTTKKEKKKKKKKKKKVAKRKSQTKDTVESLFEDLQLEADDDEEEEEEEEEEDVRQDEKVVSSSDRSYSVHRDDLSDKEKQVAEFATCSFAHARRALIESEGDVQKAIESVLNGRVTSPRKDTQQKKKPSDEDSFAMWSDEDNSFFNQEEASSAPSNNDDEIWGVVGGDNDGDDDQGGDIAAAGGGSDDGFDDDFFN